MDAFELISKINKILEDDISDGAKKLLIEAKEIELKFIEKKEVYYEKI